MPLPDCIGRYEIRAELGRGGMATVYRAYDPRIKREVAVKVLPRELLHNPGFRARFEREAETIAALEHAAILTVYDFGEEDGQPYFVMRLMTGGSLADRIEKGPLSLTEAARIFSHLAPALDWAHAHGIIHRDLKPGNILFDDHDNPCISDFGIAKLTQASVTFTGSAIVGTPAYMSPEQARGEKDIDGRSDIYALGTIVFQMLTGKFPYEADTPMGMVLKHITDPVPRILDVKPELPQACERVIERAMAKNRDDRFATAGALAETLASVARSAPTLLKPVAPEPASLPSARPLRETAAARPKRAWRGLWVAAGVAGLIILGGLIGTLWYVGRAAPAGPTATLTVRPSATEQPSATAAPPTFTPTPPLPAAVPTVDVPTATLTAPSPTPTIAPTSTPRPTRTATPKPAWVTGFAEPILAAISNRRPKIQEDFNNQSGGWSAAEFCAGQLKYAGGEMAVSPKCHVLRPQVWYPDFVAEIDARFLPGSSQSSHWNFYYRVVPGGGGYHYGFRPNGDSEACFPQPSPISADVCMDVPGWILAEPSVNHIVIIAKGQTFALYVNNQPKFYQEREYLWPNGGIMLTVGDGAVAFDNFKIWDISDLSSP